MSTEHATRPYVPPISAEDLARRNEAASRLLDAWESEGDEQEQHENMQVLRKALGDERTISSWKLFP
jgi:hypothetical protein